MEKLEIIAGIKKPEKSGLGRYWDGLIQSETMKWWGGVNQLKLNIYLYINKIWFFYFSQYQQPYQYF